MSLRCFVCVCLVIAVGLGGCSRTPPALIEPGQAAALRSAGADPGELERRDDLAVYDVDADYHPEDGSVAGSVRMRWRNRTAMPLKDLVFQCYANGPTWNGARMEILSASIDGNPATAMPFADGLGSRLVLPRPLPVGSQIQVDLTFRHTLSTKGGYHGLGCRSGAIAVLHGWFPERALRFGDAWQVAPLPELCDAARSWAYHATVDLRIPDGPAIPACGRVVEEDLPGPQRVLHIASAFSRNLTVILGPWQMVRSDVDGVTVQVWHLDRPQAALRSQARAALALRRCALIAPDPRPELDVVLAGSLGDEVGGVESSGLVIIGDQAVNLFEPLGADAPAHQLPALMLDMTVVHEVAHQWWYDLVGNDPLTSAWLDESLTSWTSCWILEGDSPATGTWAWQLTLMQSSMPDGKAYPDISVPLWESGDQVHGTQVYGRGPLAWQALRRQVGDAAWIGCLQDWAKEFRWRVATTPEWRAHLERHFGAAVIAPFWTRWIAGQGLAKKDLVEIARWRPSPSDQQKPSTDTAKPIEK